VAYLGLVGTAFAFALYFWLAGRAPALLTSLSVFACPVVAVLLGWVALGEPLGPAGLAGAGFVLYSIILTQG